MIRLFHRIKLHSISFWFSASVLLMLGANTTFLVLIQHAYSSVIDAQDHRQQSIALVNDLHQEIEQQSQFVRAYTTTGENRYLFYYYDMLAIRSGDKIAPRALNAVTYWADVIAAKKQHLLPTEGVAHSLEEKMRKAGFGKQEFNALEQVLRLLLAMNKVEQIAFAATQGLYDPVAQAFVSEGKPNLVYASQLVHSTMYNERKAELSHAVEQLIAATEARTFAEVRQETLRLEHLIILSLMSMAVTIVLVVVAFITVRRQVVKPIQFLKVVADTLTSGNYHARTERLSTGWAVEELYLLGSTLDSMAQSIEDDIRTRHAAIQQIEAALESVEAKNQQIVESITYSKVIQAAVLPSAELVNSVLGEHFIIWEPKDIVGGDIYAVARVGTSVMVAAIDCTGHGVPGALMTMITMSAIKQIISEGRCRGPAELLQKLNILINASLYHHGEAASQMDDGLEMGVCWFDLSRQKIHYAGARFPLLIAQGSTLTVLEGDRAHLGYKNANLDYVFTEKSLPLVAGQRFYLYSDGLIDQVGTNKFPFGRRRLHQLVRAHAHLDMSAQCEIYRAELLAHQGGQKRRDDVTMLGWEVKM